MLVLPTKAKDKDKTQPSNENEQDSFDVTINRAELVAIKEALGAGYTHIATDSLASIYQVKNMIFYPQRMKEHRHHHLLTAIKNIIVSRQLPTHMFKVKSHIGIIGNEIADSIATGVAKGDITPQMEVADPSNNRANEYWLHLAPHTATSDQHTKHPPNPLPDIDSHLKQHCHRRHRLGSSNQDTIYFSAVTKMNSKLNTRASRKFMTMKTVTEQERINVIKLLNGNLYTNKLAKRFGHTATDKCPLCKQPDGGYHLAGGCPQLTDSYLARHHAAGMYILEAIKAGSKGGTIIQADVGNHDKQLRAGITPLPNQISNDHLPINHRPTTSSVPDITLYERRQQGGIIKRRYTIVEIKYCTDTRPQPQQKRADLQHTALISALAKTRSNTEARLITINLGMAGYIYQDETEEQLQQLGINGQALNSLHSDKPDSTDIQPTLNRPLPTCYRHMPNIGSRSVQYRLRICSISV